MKFQIKREVKIGIFALLMLMSLYGGINFLRGTDLLGKNNTYYASYDQVNGLQTASAIVIKGYKVGTISSMSYDPSKSSKIILEFNIKSKYRIPDNSNARIYSDGLMGGKAVEIELGNSTHYLESGDTLKVVAEKDFLEVAGSEFEYMKQKATTVIDEMTATLKSVNSILTANDAYINQTMGNIAAISGSLRTVVSSESDELRGIIDNLNHLSKTLKENSSKIDNIITNVDGFTDSLRSSNIPTMVNNLSTSLAELNVTLAKVNTGSGTVGKFLNDDNLYDSLTVASSNLALLLEDIKANPGRYIHFSVFGGGNKDKSKKKK